MDFKQALLKHQRYQNALRSEEVRETLDPASLITDLYEYRDQLKDCLEEDIPRIKEQVSITNALLKKCLPDLKALEVTTAKSSVPIPLIIEKFTDADS